METRKDRLDQICCCSAYRKVEMVPPAGLEPALPKELDFESSASTNSTTGAMSL